MASSDEAAVKAAEDRAEAWQAALKRNKIPDFVTQRLGDARSGKAPWVSTLTAAELLLARSHGMRPIAMVSGTCWFHYGYSWTEGHGAGWRNALERMRTEAIACGANAVVDVKMRTIPGVEGESMDFTLLGTAVRFEGLPPAPKPVVATVSALEFVRLMEMNIVPTGLAVGAKYDWLTLQKTGKYALLDSRVFQPQNNFSLFEIANFWERVRRAAHQELRKDAASQGNGVLADVQFGQLLKPEGGQEGVLQFLGRHIVIGTVVDTPAGAPVPHGIRTVIDLRDDLSPLNHKRKSRHQGYGTNDEEGAI